MNDDQTEIVLFFQFLPAQFLKVTKYFLTVSRCICFSINRFCTFLSLQRLFWNHTLMTRGDKLVISTSCSFIRASGRGLAEQHVFRMLSCFSLSTVLARALLRSLAFFEATAAPPMPPLLPIKPGPFLPPPLEAEDSSPSMTLMSSSEKSHGAAIQIDLDLRNCDLRKNLDLRNCDLRKNLDLRKIVPTTKILERELFDLRKTFNSSPSMPLMSSSEKS